MTVTQIEKRQLVQPLDYVQQRELKTYDAVGGFIIEHTVDGETAQIVLNQNELKELKEELCK